MSFDVNHQLHLKLNCGKPWKPWRNDLFFEASGKGSEQVFRKEVTCENYFHKTDLFHLDLESGLPEEQMMNIYRSKQFLPKA